MTNIDLVISLGPNDLVVFERGQNVSDEAWGTLVFWWTNSSAIGSAQQKISVPYSTFEVRFRWLKHVWQVEGRTWNLDFGLKEKLRNSVDEHKRFEEQSTSVLLSIDGTEIGMGLKRQLTEFQKRNILHLMRMTHGADFSVPGAGKTMTALVLWHELKKAGSVSSLLVICPRSSFEAWKEEPIETFNETVNVQIFSGAAIRPRLAILVVNYEQLENLEKLTRIISWVQLNSAMVVIDEAHRVKAGGASVRWRACKQISAVAKRTDLLTGTPMPQSYDDLRNLLSLSWKNLPGHSLSDGKLLQLRRGGVFVRTTKNELALPPVSIPPPVLLSMGELQSHIYSALRSLYSGPFGLSRNEADLMGRKGRAVMTLMGAATNPGLLLSQFSDDAYLGLKWPLEGMKSDENLFSLLREYVSHEIPPKYDWVRRFIEKSARENKKVLIWSTFVGNLRALEKLLMPFNPAVVYGAIREEERRVAIDRFRKSADCAVLLTNPQTLGEGISLHRVCHDAVYLDRSYNAGLYLQSLDRIHRLGLDKDQVTNIYLLQTNGTIDQRISTRLDLKITRFANAMNDDGLVASSLPDFENESMLEELEQLDAYDEQDLYEHLMA